MACDSYNRTAEDIALLKSLGATAYRTHFTVAEGDSVTPIAAPNVAVKVADLLP